MEYREDLCTTICFLCISSLLLRLKTIRNTYKILKIRQVKCLIIHRVLLTLQYNKLNQPENADKSEMITFLCITNI